MKPIEMRNLTTFPIERLCFDLKLEVFEQLEANDVVELVKVNQGFQGMLSSRPSIVFGTHVHKIEFGFDPHEIEAINIKKLNWKSLEVSRDVIRHFPFIKNIRSCNEFLMGKDYDSPIDKDRAAFLKQLEAVDSLYLHSCPPQHLELLSHLSIKIKRNASLPSFLQKAPSKKALVGHFIETQLKECETGCFGFNDDDEFQFYYNALIKTYIKYVNLSCYNPNFIIPAIQSIVRDGIPSKNPAAFMSICEDSLYDKKATIMAFLKGYPGMKRMSWRNRELLIALANERTEGSSYHACSMRTRCFRRNINPMRDCIYILTVNEFLAFYIKPDEI